MPLAFECVRVPLRLPNPRRAPLTVEPQSIRSIMRHSARAAGATENVKDRASVTGCVRPNEWRISRRERENHIPKSLASRARSGRLHARVGRQTLDMRYLEIVLPQLYC